MNEIYEKTPFMEPLEPVDLTWKRCFWSFKGKPHTLVRDMDFLGAYSLRECLTKIKNNAEAWRELGQYTGIEVPKFEIVVGEGRAKYYLGTGKTVDPYTIYVVTERIRGRNLEEVDIRGKEKKARFNQKLDALFGSLADYYSDKYRNGGTYVSDQKLEQYVYGKAEGDLEEKMYFVDLDWQSGYYNACDRTDRENYYFFENQVKGLVFMVAMSERIFGTGLLSARVRMQALLESVLPDDPYYHLIEDIQNSINSSDRLFEEDFV